MRSFANGWNGPLHVVWRSLLMAVMVLTLVTTAVPAGADPPVPEHGREPQVAPLSPEFLAYLEEPPAISYGYVPPPFDLSHLDQLAVEGVEARTFDSRFDWRDQGKVTSVKSQSPCGMCWAFGTTSVLESAVLINESTTPEPNFSEQSLGLCVDRSRVKFYDQPDKPCEAGGNVFNASEVFIKKGAVSEACNPYDGAALQCGEGCVCDTCPAVKMVDGVRVVTDDGSRIDTIKNAVYEHGPVTASYFSHPDYYYSDPTWGTIYDYYPNPDEGNHCVSVVGWDDDVPHPNPSHGGTGAWIVKNSWGTGWGDDGYFYLTYDSSGAEEVAYLLYKDSEPTEELLYWDEAGKVSSVGWDETETAWMANVFTAPQDKALTHVDFWVTSINAAYEIYVWEGSFGSSQLAHQTGSCQEFGYYSIPLSTPIEIPGGQKFTVGVKMTTPGHDRPIPVEQEISGRVAPDIQSNVSFIRRTAAHAWSDLATLGVGYNACLRARMGAVGTASRTWNGSLSSDWHTAGNWTPSGVPTSSEDVTIPDVASAPIVSSGDAQVNSLTIHPGAELDLTDRGLTVEGTVTNKGTLKQTQSVAAGSTTQLLRIMNLAGTQTKYWGVDVTPTDISSSAGVPDPVVSAATDGLRPIRHEVPDFLWPWAQGMVAGRVGEPTPEPTYGPTSTAGTSVAVSLPTADWLTQTTVLPPEAVGLEIDLERPSKANPKLDSTLSRLLRAHRAGREEIESVSPQTVLQTDGRAQVVIETADRSIADVKRAVESLGGDYQHDHGGLLQALIPWDALDVLVERSDVQQVREPWRPVSAGSDGPAAVSGEGVGPSNAAAWHAAGYTGSGVRVAVVSLGFTDYDSLLGTDLPATVNTYDWTGTGMSGSRGGTAVAEVVHGMAPEAVMDLHKISTSVEFGNAVDQAVADGVDVIVGDVIWSLSGPGDGTGALADIVSQARASGMLYVAPAGNFAEQSWSGTYNESGSNAHLWTEGQSINWFGPGDGIAWLIPSGYPIRVGLHWDDWTAVDQDYDLALYYWDGDAWEYVDGSSRSQDGGGGQTPWEFISVDAPVEAVYGVVVWRSEATRDVCLRLTASSPTWRLDERTPERSLAFPADSPDALTVGSVDVDSPFPLESYSSRGPTFGAGGACIGGSIKPDVVGYANVSNTTYGPQGYGGTAAGAAYVGGAAALVKEAHPTYTVAQLHDYLEDNAIDMGAAGKDSLYGSGRLHLGDPPASGNHSPEAPGNPTPPHGATNQSASVDLAWSGGDPDTGDTVRYDVYFGTSSPPPFKGTVGPFPATQTSLSYDPGPLAQGTQYFWRIVANDNHGASTTGSTWTFTTGTVDTGVTVSVSGDQRCVGRATGVMRCYDVAPEAAMDATVRFYFREAERSGLALEDLVVFRYVDAWTAESGPCTRGGDGEARFVEAQNVGDFSRFALDAPGTGPAHAVFLPLVLRNAVPDSGFRVGGKTTTPFDFPPSAIGEIEAGGHTFRFPEGGTGELVTAPILRSPYEPYPGDGMYVEYTGANQVEMILPGTDDWTDDRPMLYVYAQVQGAFDDDIGPGKRWISLPYKKLSDGRMAFGLPPAGDGPAGRDPVSTAVEGVGQVWAEDDDRPLHYWISRIEPGTDNMDRQIYVENQKEAYIEHFLVQLDTATEIAVGGRMAREPLRIHYGGAYYTGFKYFTDLYYYFKPIVSLPLDPVTNLINSGALAHEMGHYFNHLLVGDDYVSLERQGNLWPLGAYPIEHTMGDPVGRGALLEEYAYFIEYFLRGRTGPFDLHHPYELFGTVMGSPSPSKTDYPGVEGFSAHMLASLVRTDEQMKTYDGGEYPVPLIGLSYTDVFPIIAEGATNADDLRAEVFQTADPQRLTVMLQRLGWQYRAKGRLVDAQGDPVSDATIKNIIEIGDVVYESGGDSCTNEYGTFHLPGAFGGASTLRITLADDREVDVDIPPIDWSELTTTEIELGDIAVPDSGGYWHLVETIASPGGDYQEKWIYGMLCGVTSASWSEGHVAATVNWPEPCSPSEMTFSGAAQWNPPQRIYPNVAVPLDGLVTRLVSDVDDDSYKAHISLYTSHYGYLQECTPCDIRVGTWSANATVSCPEDALLTLRVGRPGNRSVLRYGISVAGHRYTALIASISGFYEYVYEWTP